MASLAGRPSERGRRRPVPLILVVAVAVVAVSAWVSPSAGGRLTERDDLAGLSGRKAATLGPVRKAGPASRSASHSLAFLRYQVASYRRQLAREKQHRARLQAELRRHLARRVQAHARETDWRAKQIAAAEKIGQGGDAGGTDPWPNCPDPYDHRGASWDDTVACENSGSWLDSPGYFRCGLQFEPRWERVYGRLCP